MKICHLYISPGHNFVGHYGREPDTHPAIEVPMIECVAGRGIRGDRYFDFKDDYKGQITFFSLDVFGELCSAMQLRDSSPAPARRNVITRGVDLNALIGSEFEVHGGRLFGMAEWRPWYRMGRDKASILIRGKPLWEHQLEKLRKVQPEQLFVSARIDPSWRPGDVRFVADTAPSRGPLSGLAASIERMTTSHLLALAVDMPWMSKTYLEFLCAQIEPGRGVVPKIGDRAEPLAAIYPQEANGDFRNALTGADFSLQPLVRRLVDTEKLREISVTEEEQKLFWNVNELSDLTAL